MLLRFGTWSGRYSCTVQLSSVEPATEVLLLVLFLVGKSDTRAAGRFIDNDGGDFGDNVQFFYASQPSRFGAVQIDLVADVAAVCRR